MKYKTVKMDAATSNKLLDQLFRKWDEDEYAHFTPFINKVLKEHNAKLRSFYIKTGVQEHCIMFETEADKFMFMLKWL